MRIYIIGNDGVTLCREPPATVNKGAVRGVVGIEGWRSLRVLKPKRSRR